MISSLAKLATRENAQRLTPHERANTATEENRVVYKLKSRLSDVELVPFYTGRCEENAQIRQLFQQGRSRITVVLSGLGGIGKTQIALKYAKVHESEYDAIYWVNCRSMDTVKQSLFAVAERIHLQNPSLPGWKEVLESQDIEKTSLAVIDWLSQTHNDRWLVICDGYGQGPTDDSSLENWNLHKMIRTNHGHILITSRWPQSDVFHHISVEKFTDMSLGVDLLLKCSKKPALRNDPDVQRLAQTLDGLPLALVAAGAYLRHYPYSCAEYLDAYNQSWLRLLKKTPTSEQYDLTLYSTWDLTLDRIRKVNELAAILLRFCACFDNNDLWFELFQTRNELEKPKWLQTLTANKLEFGDAVRILHEHAMVELHAGVTDNRSGSIGFRIHNCVHSWIIHVLNENWDYGMSSLALGCIASTVPHDGTSYWHISQRLLAHGNRAIDLFFQKKLTQGCTVGQGGQIQTIIDFFLRLGRPEAVVEMCRRLHEELEQSFGEINMYRHPTTLMLKWDMIRTLMRLRKYDQAEIWCNRVLSRLSNIPNGRGLKRIFIYLMAWNSIFRGQTEKGTQLLIGGLDECQDDDISPFPLEEYLMPAIWAPYLFKEMPTDLQTWLGNYMNQQGTVTMDNHQPSFKYLCTQIYLFLSRHDNGTAKALLAEAREIFDRVDSADYAKASMFPALMALYLKLEDQRQIQSLCEAAFTGDWETLWQSDSQHSFLMAFTRIYAHVACCQFDKAVIACQKTLDKLKESQVPCPVHRFDVLFMLGSLFIAQGRVFDAEEHLTAAIDLTAAIIGQAENTSYRFKRLTDMMDYVRECYEQQGDQAGAQRCLKLVQGCRSERLGTDT
ncbi:hypothetical protein CNMCM6106_003241 [Aspergillus hiratsukae]|uniref:NB-ARC domain-containing protein n=1 Tax=Aspergillus hiratsukae TaxID=1194566 RepID=A0A8H6UYX6_9EURO|nr:hypothetical protein CNMCM6106_003241 [Aspergillus hiratsukae]